MGTLAGLKLDLDEKLRLWQGMVLCQGGVFIFSDDGLFVLSWPTVYCLVFVPPAAYFCR